MLNGSPSLSHKSLYSSTPVLADNKLHHSHSQSFSTPPPLLRLQPSRRSPSLRTSPRLNTSYSPLLRSSIANLQESPLKASPPLSDMVIRSTGHTHPIVVSQAFHNSFYALQLNILIKGQPVELNLSEDPKLSCEQLTCSILFRPIYNELQQLLKEFGVTSIIRCFSDPLPFIELAFANIQSVRNLLLHKDEITPYIWVMICNEFINTSKDIGIPLLKGEEKDSNAVRFQLTHRPGNNCNIDLYLVSPVSDKREVDICPVTLANLDHANKLLMSSLVFNFPEAMLSFHISTTSTLEESVLLSDLKEEFKEMKNWFHMGIYLDFKPSVLMNTLFNCRKIGACRSQFLSAWHNQRSSALGDNTLTWTEIVSIAVDIGQRSIADSIVKKYGLDVNKYHEMLKQQQKDTKQQGILSESKVALLICKMKEIDTQIAEKIKPLKTYELQRKNLELSVNEVFKSLKMKIETLQEKSRERMKLKESIQKASEEMKALEATLQLFHTERPIFQVELEIPPAAVEAPLQAAHQKYITEILEEKASQRQSFEGRLGSLSREIKALTKEIIEQRSSLIKEHQLLLSKCQQIHQLQGIAGLLQAKATICGIEIDHALQQKFAARSMFKSSVFQLHIDTLTQEQKEIEFQLNLHKAREKRAQKMASETQSKLEEMDLNEETGEMIFQGAEGEEDEDKRLEEWLKPVVESVELRNKSLKAKISQWSNERSKRITSAEGKALAEMLSALKEIVVDSQEKPDVQEETDSEPTLKVECTLLPNQGYQAVKANTMIGFTVKFEPTVKLNPKKFNYRVDIKSIANNSVTTVKFTLNTSTTPHSLTMDFRPSVRGRHQILILCNNKPLKGAGLYLFYAKQTPTLLGYPVRVIEGFNYPYNICSISNSQVLLVSESKGRKIVFVDKGSGNKVLNIDAKEVMKIPNGITITEDGIICVVDSGNHCICLFTQQGVPLGKFGNKGDTFNEFLFPYGIKTSPFDKSICVCDHNNDRIQIFTNDLKFQRVIHASSPYDVAFDSKKCMYVADQKNHLIAVFNERDQCIHSISGKGTMEGKLHEPRGLAIDEQDYIYVVEERNCRVSVFDNVGQFVACFGTEGTQPGEFSAPQGLCIDEDGYIYVCDMLNNRIQVF